MMFYNLQLKVLIILLVHSFIMIPATAVGQGHRTDSELIMEAKVAMEKYRDCRAASAALQAVSAKGKKHPLWLYFAAKAFECDKNYSAALDMYKRYDKAMPGQDEITKKIGELSYLIRTAPEREAAERRQAEESYRALQELPVISQLILTGKDGQSGRDGSDGDDGQSSSYGRGGNGEGGGRGGNGARGVDGPDISVLACEVHYANNNIVLFSVKVGSAAPVLYKSDPGAKITLASRGGAGGSGGIGGGGGDGGRGANGTMRSSTGAYGYTTFYYEGYGDGGYGGRGGNGGTGGDGGNGGRIQVFTSNSSILTMVMADSAGGMGGGSGSRGYGGSGGSGGFGGGKSGDTGPNGFAGSAGRNGRKGDVTVELGPNVIDRLIERHSFLAALTLR